MYHWCAYARIATDSHFELCSYYEKFSPGYYGWGESGKQVSANSEEGVPKAKARFFALKSKGDP